MKKSNRIITGTITQWAVALAMDPHTLEARLVEAGDPPRKDGEQITARRIYDAFAKSEYAQRVRNLTLDADRKEREERDAMERLFPLEHLDPLLERHILRPIERIFREKLLADGAAMAKINPQQPELARKVIAEWIENSLKPVLQSARNWRKNL